MATTLPAPAEPADHHYVPEFYLKGFMDKEHSLWVYEHGENAPRKSTPKQEGHRPNYYSVAHEGQQDDFAETGLGKIESFVAPVIRKLANPQFKIKEHQFGELYVFVALMYVRVPAWREYADTLYGLVTKNNIQKLARNKEEFHKTLKEFEDRTGKPISEIEKAREFYLSDKYTVTQGSAGFNITMMLELGLAFSEIFLSEYKHDIYYAPADTFFMTCDNPIVTMEPDFEGGAIGGVSIRRQRAEVVFPLNKRACLFLRRYGEGRNLTASTRQVDQINDMIMNVAQKCLYAPVGYRRLARVFTERGCKIKYGKNALVPDTLNIPEP